MQATREGGAPGDMVHSLRTLSGPDRQQGERSAGQGRWLEAAKADTGLVRPHLA